MKVRMGDQNLLRRNIREITGTCAAQRSVGGLEICDTFHTLKRG